jgi:CRP/FNR family cyclic AMP-dependent transcriptional regulator
MTSSMNTKASAEPRSKTPPTGQAFGPSILNDLPAPYSTRLLEGATTVSLSDGQSLFRKGDAGDGCYWLHDGLLKVSVASPAGEKRTLAILGPGAIVGELAMIDGLPRSADVQAIGDCRLTFVSTVAFTECLSGNPALYRHVSAALATRLRQANDEAAAASFLSVKERIARTLFRLADYLGEEMDAEHIVIRHHFSQNDIAAMAALARESVNRTMSEWRQKGIVALPTRATMVVHKAKLAAELQSHSKTNSDLVTKDATV